LNTSPQMANNMTPTRRTKTTGPALMAFTAHAPG
jgi:hypothetical protein